MRYSSLVPPHSTTVNPVRSGAVNVWLSSPTHVSDGFQVINTRITVSGVGDTMSLDDFVYSSVSNEMML